MPRSRSKESKRPNSSPVAQLGSLLVVTHDPKVRTIADRVLQIRDGRLVA